MQTKSTPKVTSIVVKGVNSEVAEELDLEIIKTVMEWFVSEAPKELRTLHNVGRVIRMNDRLINLIAAETKSSVDYIEKRALERHGLPVDGDRRYEEQYEKYAGRTAKNMFVGFDPEKNYHSDHPIGGSGLL